MNTEINLPQILAESFLKAGYPIDINHNNILLQPLNLFIEAEVLSVVNPDIQSSSVTIIITCRHEKMPDGITEFATGFGDTYLQAIEQAFSNWIISDFPPIHDYLCNSGHLLGVYSETVSSTGELEEIIGWDLYFGPCLEGSQKLDTLEIVENKKDQKQIQQTLFQPMTDALFGNPGLYYIRTFMSKINNTEIDCDCRVNGNEWEHGKNYLIDFMTKYHAKSSIFWIKQNVLLVNKSADQIQSSKLVEELTRELSKQKEGLSQTNKKWWKIWQ